jgi:hypothetical protein
MKSTTPKPSRPTPTRRRRRTKADCALASRLIELLREGQDIRTRKTRRTRAAIKVRSYENDLKLQVAIERLIDELSPV